MVLTCLHSRTYLGDWGQIQVFTYPKCSIKSTAAAEGAFHPTNKATTLHSVTRICKYKQRFCYQKIIHHIPRNFNLHDSSPEENCSINWDSLFSAIYLSTQINSAEQHNIVRTLLESINRSFLSCSSWLQRFFPFVKPFLV